MYLDWAGNSGGLLSSWLALPHLIAHLSQAKHANSKEHPSLSLSLSLSQSYICFVKLDAYTIVEPWKKSLAQAGNLLFLSNFMYNLIHVSCP